ncbi:uncharacterized protein N7529_001249 [Penicillium soppii]|uniref:uncharacterized protein n=1 Tax=Penicillium soppii TaxID=69789 RepID=UPI002548AADE|nr:uncharacterized protein N7529_001249 [Penicillium soppii]KAJ5882577.1 hypothetical protein N7529_001249 [Penicillium soppii]
MTLFNDSFLESLRAQIPTHIQVISEGHAAYEDVCATWNIRSQCRPIAVVQPNTTNEVCTVIRVVNNLGVRQVAVRGGGHSFEGLSLGGQDGAIVIDMVKMKMVSSLPTKYELTAQGGALLSDIHLHAFENGKKMVPLGTCPSVGVGGHVQCGGYGFHSRTYGPLVDRAIAFEVVTADGEVVVANDSQNTDLFYALRGSGMGSFGVITSVTLQTNDVPNTITNFSIVWDLKVSDLPQILTKAQSACLDAPLFYNPMIIAWAGKFEIFGTILAPCEATRDASWKRFLSFLPRPSFIKMQPMDYLESVLDISKNQTSAPWYDDLKTIGREKREHFRFMKIKSGFIREPLDDESIQAIGNFLATQPSTGVRVQLLALDASDDGMPDTSVRARRCTWLMGMSAYITKRDHTEDELIPEGKCRLLWLNQAYDLFRPLSVGAYLGDDDLDEGNNFASLMESFYGHHFPGLKRVKGKYDPRNLFNHPLSIPLPTVD